MIRYVRLLGKRFATCLAVVAALAFVADGALGADHHLGATPASSGHHHAHSHSHGHVHAYSHSHAASDHRQIGGDVAEAIDLATGDGGSAPVSGSDACCCCTCNAALVLPSLNAQAVPFVLLRTIATVDHRHGDGVVPDGLRRPPRPTAIT